MTQNKVIDKYGDRITYYHKIVRNDGKIVSYHAWMTNNGLVDNPCPEQLEKRLDEKQKFTREEFRFHN